ncbi:MAG TPA: DUF554 domain-containing protein [Anaerolineales bacterium]|nr:DUF554 domain-containing protein [Anaerolineales bacterium]HRQ91806.1 DUF554 domain-containing protein [Anaerolineales bacterium]
MVGTILNVITVLVGGALGLLFGARIPERMRHTIVAGLGLFTLAIGARLSFESSNSILILLSLLVGGVLGELMNIEDRLEVMGAWLQERFAANAKGGKAMFVRGFLTASLLFCIGPMTILGSIQDGLSGDYELLAIKSILDGFAGMVFASSLGMGVLFSAVVVLIYQGGLSLLAQQANSLLSAEMITEMTAVGGILLLGIAVSSLLEIKKIRVGNFLPALVIAPLLVALLTHFGINLQP